MQRRLFAAAAFLAVAVSVRADVTLRYAYDVKPGPMMPPQALEAVKSQIADMKMLMLLKGNKAYVQMMGFTGITNFDGALVTLLDAKNKRYATASQAEYTAAAGKQITLPPEARKALDSMKMDIKSRVTGQSKTIQGIRAEEREIEITVDLPGPQGSPGQLRVLQSVWAPDQDALIQNAAMRELAAYADRAWVGLNPSELMGKMFGQMPGLGEKLKAMTQEFKAMRAMLGSRTAMYLPGMAAMMDRLRKAGQPVPENVDPNAPMMEMTMDLVELSTAPVPESRFEVPKDYKLAPLEEVLQSIMPKPGNMPGRP